MRVLTASFVAACLSISVSAHEMTVKGTVAAIETARVQVKTGEEKKDQSPAWYGLDAKTKIQRGKTVVTLEQANIKAGERVVLIVDHQTNGTMKTVEMRLASE